MQTTYVEIKLLIARDGKKYKIVVTSKYDWRVLVVG